MSVTADNACGHGLPHMSLVNVNPLPAVPVITGNSMGLSTTTYAGYQWYLNGNILNGADTAVYYPLQNGSYTVVVTSIFGCTAVSAPYTVVNAGIMEAIADGISIDPMPFDESFTISWLSHQIQDPGKTMVIYDGLGRKFKEWPLPSSAKIIVETVDWRPGMYFYLIRINGRILSYGKLIKQ